MTPQDRLMAVFRGEKPDVMPWFADLTYWYSAHEARGDLPSKYLGEEGRLRLYRELGCGAHEELYNLPAKVSFRNVKVRVYDEKLQGGRILRRTVYTLPDAELTSVQLYRPETHSWAYIKYAVSSPEDFRALREIYRCMDATPDYELQYRRLDMWRGVGVVSSLPPRTPFSRLLIEWAGPMNLFKALLRFREEVDETYDVLAESDNLLYEIIRESPAPLVYFGENITSEFISPRIFKRYFTDYYRRRAEELHASGKYIYVHVDGALRGVLPLMGETGVDCVQSVTPAPVGDVAVEDLRRMAGDRLILWGGLPGVYFSTQYPERFLRDMAFSIIEHHLEGAKFIMGVADQVPPDGDINRVKTVTEIVEKYARY